MTVAMPSAPSDLAIRFCSPHDVPIILYFIRALARYEKPARAGDKEAQKMVVALKPVVATLNEGRPARAAGLDAEGMAAIKPLCLMTVKPTLYVANVSEGGFHDNPMLDALRAYAAEEGAPVGVGAGKRSLPEDMRLNLELLDERRFGNGTVFLHYRVRS